MHVSFRETAKIKHSSLKSTLPTTRLATIPPESAYALYSPLCTRRALVATTTGVRIAGLVECRGLRKHR